MPYSPTADFLGLMRQQVDGVSLERMPGLDYVVAALARAGLIKVFIGQSAPMTNRPVTAWFKPALPSWTAEGTLFLWDANAGAYALATPLLWTSLLLAVAHLPPAPSTIVTHAMSPYTPLSSDTYLSVDATGGAVEISLLQSVAQTSELSIKDDTGSAPVHSITVRPHSGETVDNYTNLAPLILVSAYDGVRLRPRINGYSIAP